jgi:hypothetical protein
MKRRRGPAARARGQWASERARIQSFAGVERRMRRAWTS